ncbi:unnamed protein product [Schistosoma rodhaini]|nr:unnamed protein product [Schistosoma rodhaini]
MLVFIKFFQYSRRVSFFLECLTEIVVFLMSALFNFQSLLSVILLLICTCAYIRHFSPTLLDSRKHGLLGLFWKCARIGERKSPYVAVCCILMAGSVLFSSQSRYLSNRLSKESGSSSGSNSSFFSDTFISIAITGAFLGSCLAFRWYVNRLRDYSITEKKNPEKSGLEPEVSSASNALEIPVTHASESALNTSPIQHETRNSSDHSPVIVEQQQLDTSDSVDSQVTESVKNSVKEVTNSDFHDEIPESLVYIKPEDEIFPSHVPYIIVGAGAAGMSAARSIRASDPTSRILLISGGGESSTIAEPGIEETSFLEPPPYLRPPLINYKNITPMSDLQAEVSKISIDSPSPLSLKINHWFAVSAWKWCTNDDDCGICRNAFETCCADCKLPGDDCPLVWGQCNHCFHMHCIIKWLNSQQMAQHCPLCRQDWRFRE